MDSKNNYKVIGLMSGTSLDGLDVAYCQFSKAGKVWKYEILRATTIDYTAAWTQRISSAHHLSGEDLVSLNVAYGKLLGKLCKDFIQRNKIGKVDFIASHGHTIFHQPAKGFTYQIGDGSAIYAECGVPVVYDFRSLDVMRGGQGAPLVPAGDKVLFSNYDVCLNLGGIANLSIDIRKQRKAYDICFANMGLNHLARQANKKYDAGGAMAEKGDLNVRMLQALNKIYEDMRLIRPSLGRELFEEKILGVLNDEKISLNDRLRTCTESIAMEIVKAVTAYHRKLNVLCTGGGAFNSFLISKLLEHGGDDVSWIVPDENVVKYKEALVFAFLGVLRARREVNCLKSVTGALSDSSSGVLAGF
jgi:anhydro-N-acetylmuramic acid kinase